VPGWLDRLATDHWANPIAQLFGINLIAGSQQGKLGNLGCGH